MIEYEAKEDTQLIMVVAVPELGDASIGDVKAYACSPEGNYNIVENLVNCIVCREPRVVLHQASPTVEDIPKDDSDVQSARERISLLNRVAEHDAKLVGNCDVDKVKEQIVPIHMGMGCRHAPPAKHLRRAKTAVDARKTLELYGFGTEIESMHRFEH